MKVLIVGSGAREHALAEKIAESPLVETLYGAPGNPGMETVELRSTGLQLEPVRISVSDICGLRLFAWCVGVNLTVVGPEVPLALGIVDRFLEWGLPIVGPTMAAAKLEASKVFAKRFMWEHGILMARGVIPPTFEIACASIRDLFRHEQGPLFVKADGLAAGKGAFYCSTEARAIEVAHSLMVEKVLGEAGQAVVIDRCLFGDEVSVHILTNGTEWWWLPVAQDYKRLTDDPTSSMTGGMGTISHESLLSRACVEEVAHTIIEPTLKGMRERGTPYRGVLYVGLMVVKGKPYVLEYNARFGDPEAQVILPRICDDIVPYLCRIADRPPGDERALPFCGDVTLPPTTFLPHAHVSVVLASEGYPQAKSYSRYPIEGLDAANALEHIRVYHAGTIRGSDGRLFTFGGRVLGVDGEGDTLEEARDRAYTAVEKIYWPGMLHRRDIGGRIYA